MIEFCKTTFGAVEMGRRQSPNGTVVHALLTISAAMIMPTLANRAPQPDGSSLVVIFVYVEDVDQTVERAVAAGAKVLIPVKNQFWGRPHRVDYGSVRPRVAHRDARRRDFVGGEGETVVQHTVRQLTVTFRPTRRLL